MFTLTLPLVQQVVSEIPHTQQVVLELWCEDCGRIALKMMSRIEYNIDPFDEKNNFSI